MCKYVCKSILCEQVPMSKNNIFRRYSTNYLILWKYEMKKTRLTNYLQGYIFLKSAEYG